MNPTIHRDPTGGPLPADHPLRPLQVIRRLTIEAPRVEPNRVTAAYRVEQNGGTDAFEFAYRFEENVFDPQRGADLNLASMMTVQPALNYGLFCDEIVFEGSLDAVDQRLVTDMTENTAREIYVNKLLAENPFLQASFLPLPAIQQSQYTAAALHFRGESPAGRRKNETRSMPAMRDRFMVLSSGGKDSLLTYGLLAEMGAEVHPVFVNESGKHWFTALNAYRHFAAQVPRTARVWTNADRLFNWMLRRMSFIRPDFGDVRSDMYPLRLWTVAVFLFGVLPLARARGTGCIVIGNEYDTTEKRTQAGITHFSGLFDQSRYFDETLTRYYAAKQWRTVQFSLLRPLSELLIEKILAERYPSLLRLQTSCHATHKDGDQIRPCGRCEKCRRIVTMLAALGQDPAACGYKPEHLPRCVAALLREGVHQERAGLGELLHLLAERGLCSEDEARRAGGRVHPEILQLRFDRERSPVDAIPADLRRQLYPRMLAHANGAVRRRGRVWTPFDPLATEALARPYAFDRKKRHATDAQPAGGSDEQASPDYLLATLTWPQAEARLKTVDVALLPVGAIEQHGPHLPLDTDAFDADYLARQVARACSDPRPLVLPLIPYGVSYHHDDFRGTISVTNETLSRMVYEIGIGVARNGITKLVIVNGHGGNAATLHFAAQMINRDAHIFTCVDTGETSDADIEKIAETAGDIHAGEIETSTTLATRPELVNMRKARKSVPKFSSRYLDFSSRRSVDWYARTAKISPSGVMGDPSRASREKGERIWEVMIRNLLELVEHLKSMSLDEIHQRNRF